MSARLPGAPPSDDTPRVQPAAPHGEARRAGARGLGLLLPASWWVVDLRDAATRRRSVASLVEQQVGRSDERASLRADLRRQMTATADDAARAGGLVLALSLMEAGGIPVPASVTLYRLPDGDLAGTGVAQLEAVLRSEAGADETLDLADGPSGPVLRRVRRRQGPADLGADRLSLLMADYWVDPGDGAGLAYLAFSSPLVQAADGLLQLFDVITSSVAADGSER